MYIWYWTNSYWNLQIWNLLEKDENILRVQLFFRALECDFAKINNNRRSRWFTRAPLLLWLNDTSRYWCVFVLNALCWLHTALYIDLVLTATRVCLVECLSGRVTLRYITKDPTLRILLWLRQISANVWLSVCRKK